MSKGFDALDDDAIKALEAMKTPHRQRLVLLRLPQDFKLKHLHGVSLNLDAVHTDQILPSADGGMVCQALNVEGNLLSHSLCPIIRDGITRKPIIGESFAQTVSAKKIYKFSQLSSKPEVKVSSPSSDFLDYLNGVS